MQRNTSGGTRREFAATVLFTLLLAASPRALADYPIASHRYLADPGSLVYKGRVYLYTSNDDDNTTGYNMRSNVCVSSADLKNWTDHGVVFQVPKDTSWAGLSWAPQPVERNGTIYLYFGNNVGGVGVASSTDPIGEFKDAKGSYLVNGTTPGVASGGWYFDPGVLIDDDGQAYLAFGGNGNQFSNIIKLGSDLISISGAAVTLPVQNFLEASFLFKRNGTYYVSYSTTGSTGQRIDYLMSKSPMTGYSYVGTIADGPPQNSNNNQASEFEFNGQWYHAYHNRFVARQAGIDPTFKRNLGIEMLNFNADGTIQKVAYTTDGVPQVGTLNPYERVEAETTNAQSGIETEICSEGGMDVTSINDGDWIRVRGVNFGSAGARTFSARVASTGAGGAIELHLKMLTGLLIGTCSVPATGGAQTWQTITCNVNGANGTDDLYLRFVGGGFNFNYWQFGGGSADIDAGVAGGGGTGSGGAGGGGAGSGDTSGSGGGVETGGAGGRAGTGGSGGRTTGGVSGTGGGGGTAGNGGAAAGSGGSRMAGTGGAPAPDGGAPNATKVDACACVVSGGDKGLTAIGLGVGLLLLRRRRAKPATVSSFRSEP